MRRRKGGDASFWMGLILGIFIGAAVALVLTPAPGDANRAKLVDKAQEATGSLEGRIRDAQDKT